MILIDFLEYVKKFYAFLKTTIMIKVTLVVILHLTHSLSLHIGGERGHVSYQNVVFGVGLDNQNIAFSKIRKSENTVAGVLGLACGYRSILKQL